MIALVEKLLYSTYRVCGYLASVFIALIVVMVVINIFDRLVGGYTAGTNEFASYCVAAAGALGLAYTFGQKKHIRMTLLINHTRGPVRKILELTCLLIAVGFSLFMSYYLCTMVITSATLGDRSIGSDGIFLWIAQAPMALGFFVFSLSLVHALVRVLFSSEQAGD